MTQFPSPSLRQLSEVGIYKGKQESKKTRKHALDQESGQEIKEKTFFFSWSFSWSRACFLSYFPFILVFFYAHTTKLIKWSSGELFLLTSSTFCSIPSLVFFRNVYFILYYLHPHSFKPYRSKTLQRDNERLVSKQTQKRTVLQRLRTTRGGNL